jgi:hypothetical protein
VYVPKHDIVEDELLQDDGGPVLDEVDSDKSG